MSLLGIGVAGLALDRAIPFGRVWSFPKEIVITNSQEALALAGRLPIGTTIRIRIPQRFIIRDRIDDFSQPPQWREEIILEPHPELLP
jgi:hypothetical protein